MARVSPPTGEPFASEIASWVASYPTIGWAGDHQTSMLSPPETDATVAAGGPGKTRAGELGITAPPVQAAAASTTASASGRTPEGNRSIRRTMSRAAVVGNA